LAPQTEGSSMTNKKMPIEP